MNSCNIFYKCIVIFVQGHTRELCKHHGFESSCLATISMQTVDAKDRTERAVENIGGCTSNSVTLNRDSGRKTTKVRSSSSCRGSSYRISEQCVAQNLRNNMHTIIFSAIDITIASNTLDVDKYLNQSFFELRCL